MDFSRMSDAELEAIANSATTQHRPGPDFEGLSDAELERIANSGASGGPSDQYPHEKGSAPAKTTTSIGELANAYARAQGLGARTTWGGMAKTALSLGTLPLDAAVNAGYGLHKLAAKTGAVSEPNPDFYYGKGGSYLPATSGISDAVDDGLSKIAEKVPGVGGYLRAAETPTERILSAVGEGAVGALTGAGLGRALATNGSGAARMVGGFLAERPALQGVSGAAGGGAAQGAREAGADDTTATVLGMAAGAATGAAGARATRPRAAPIPTTEELRAAKSAAYARSEAAGVEFTPDAVRDLDSAVRGRLRRENVFLDTKPEARDVLDPLTRSHMPDASGQRSPVSLARVDDIRQQASALRSSANATERRTGRILADEVDGWLDNAHAGQLTRGSGDAAEGITALREGQRANRRFAKASALDDALDKAERRTARTGTGSNGENVDRQNLSRILDNPRKAAQFDPAEREAMQRIVMGSRTQNALRFGSRFAPTGTVSGILGLSAAASGYGAIPLAGLAAKGAGDYLHGRNMRNLENLVKGGPGAGQRPTARTRVNASRGALRGFLAAPEDERGRGRYQ